jgi:hypothetical protein
LEAETVRRVVESLKRQLRQSEMEREILEKAVAIFSVADQADRRKANL